MFKARWIMCLWLLAGPTAALAESIWIEGESCTDHTFTHHGWYDAVRKDALSGGEWLSHYNEQRPGEARFTVNVTAGGDHVL